MKYKRKIFSNANVSKHFTYNYIILFILNNYKANTFLSMKKLLNAVKIILRRKKFIVVNK